MNTGISMGNANFKKGEEAFKRQDYVEAMRCYQTAADQGNVMAQCNIGVLYLYGLGVQKDYLVAMQWFKESAKGGCEQARRMTEYVVG
jgi:TPR repeat protein